MKYQPKRQTYIQQVSEFCNPGSLITNKYQSTADIKRRIAFVKQAFHKNYRKT